MVKREMAGAWNISLDVSFDSNAQFYGLPERVDSFNIKDTLDEFEHNKDAKYDKKPYRLYTKDHFSEGRDSIYGAIPMLLSRKPGKENVSAFFWSNSSETYVDIF
eukprot:CAMPEP_0116872026 /NCGR_PEP_ID=MMETSP0463-20121206/2646_1 /TAXON_ID=181622 /ORGANISM="Strombidinopsis sp, Strain SopsisLIS2011" /LENGTH=104 /DNA_ID=CAMNT_0004511575 /DNA_START=411 /DNA_END=725 /DNA_ORIENTATION=-